MRQRPERFPQVTITLWLLSRSAFPRRAIYRAGGLRPSPLLSEPAQRRDVTKQAGRLAVLEGTEAAMSSISDQYAQAIQRYNAGDIDGYVAFYAEDAAMTLPAGTFLGPAAIREAWGREAAAFPDQVLTIGITVEQGGTLADEFTWAGTNTGPLVLRDGTEVPPTGRRAEIKGMELVQMRDGEIALHHVYFDYMALLSQLGLLPRAATA